MVNVTGAGKNHLLQAFITTEEDLTLPKPDTAQMIPYKPKANPLPGEHPVPGRIEINDLFYMLMFNL